ncbi:MEDS domain-containing protein [Mycolicibacterium bacteremicum]|uniref:ANTAR domain-containing protein n=1 Tax=Mycolicibacterium bacteremicum TaxID=564198 RepID=A0A1W9YZ14_MYCBA|nr:MEDS domain-containing protein [Mycolicibacterium bacteremicum]MCV7435078.1 MEDS domain-containing protein [Mycolicibacterium bacteremicum]ORA05316.1 hypothetical protein BST17_08850 [Mycolicibacterium bacteremicum]
MTPPGRRHGVLDSAAGLVPFGHLGWGYRRRRDFAQRANEYLTDGLRHGQRVVYVGAGTVDTLNEEVDGLRRHMPVDVADGWVEVIPVDEFYVFERGSDVVDPDASVLARVAATEQALAQGFTGFRAVVDVTAVARTERQRESFSMFELLIDQQMARLPVSALCAYDVSALGAAADKLMCLHPYVNAGSVPIRVYTGIGADLTVSGHLQSHARHDVIDVLRDAWRRSGRPEITVDARAAGGDGHTAVHALTELEAAAAFDGVFVTLWTAQAGAAALADRLGLNHVRIDVVPETGEDIAVEHLHARIAQLTNRMAGAPAIEQAKGMLMLTFELSDDAAFALLRQLSQDNNVVLREVAERVVAAFLSHGPRPGRDVATEFLRGVRDELRNLPR